jgi:predicted phage tail component-like protein
VADGDIAIADASWSTARGASTGSGLNYVTDPDAIVARLSGGTYTLSRAFYPFSLSTLSKTIMSGSLVLTKQTASAEVVDLCVFEGTQASPLTTADLDAFTGAELASRAASPTALYETVTLPLNAAGIAYLNSCRGGTAKLCVRTAADVDNAAPSTNLLNNFFSSENSAVAYRPTLWLLLDTTAPTTVSDAVIAYMTPAVITLTATDNTGGSGVDATYYKLDGAGSPTAYTTPISVSTTGTHTIEFWSVDVAGNEELPHNMVQFLVVAAQDVSDSFTFNGLSSAAFGLHVEKYIRSITAEQSQVTTEIPGMRGSYLHRSKTLPRREGFLVSFLGTTQLNAQEIKRALAAWLVTDVPAPLATTDEPGLILWASLTGTTDLDQIAAMRRGTISFDCYDPDLQSATEDETDISSPAGVTGGSCATVQNGGNLATWPREEITLDGPASFLTVTHAETGAHITLGTPESDTAPADAETLQLNLDCTTMTGTSDAGDPDNGDRSGVMVSSGSTMSPQHVGGSFGTGTTWHGPMARAALTAPAEDFRVDARFHLQDSGGVTGRIEFYLNDTTTAVMGKLSAYDNTKASKRVGFNARAGALSTGHNLFSGLNPNGATLWNTLNPGRMTMQRVGNRWSASMSAWDAKLKKWVHVVTKEWLDVAPQWKARGPYSTGDNVNHGGNGYTCATGNTDSTWTVGHWTLVVTGGDIGTYTGHNLGSIDVHIGVRYVDAPLTTMTVWNLWAYSINGTPPAVPNIIAAGQTLIIDHERCLITLDGDDAIMQYKTLDSDFFTLPPGPGTLIIDTNDGLSVDGNCYLRKRYK